MRGYRAGFIGKGVRSHGILTLAAVFALAVALTGCPKKPAHKRIPSRVKVPPKEVMEPAKAPETVSTPERAASERLVGRGVILLDEGRFERAASAFRDAVNIDTTNGVAYYYLAYARARLDEPEVALGLLDKAEALLSHDEDWMRRIDELRRELGAEESREVAPSPIDEAF